MPWATRSNPSEEAHVSILDNQNDALRSTVNYKPEVGNGFLATVVGSDALYVAGVFNGFGDLSVQPSQKPSFGVSAGAQRERRGRYEVINHGSLNVADYFPTPLWLCPVPVTHSGSSSLAVVPHSLSGGACLLRTQSESPGASS